MKARRAKPRAASNGLPAIRLTDDVGQGNSGTGTVATGNVVTLNQIVDNALDLVSSAAGPNRITLNRCSASVPVEPCDRCRLRPDPVETNRTAD